MACDNNDHAAIFQVTNANSSNVTIVHNTGASVSPGNCSKYLGCSCDQLPNNPNNPNNPNSCSPTFENGFISKLAAYAWYIGYNGRGGRSLYRLKLQKELRNGRWEAGDTAEEVAEGVSDLQIQYLIDGRYVDASDASLVVDPKNWTKDASNASLVDLKNWTKDASNASLVDPKNWTKDASNAIDPIDPWTKVVAVRLEFTLQSLEDVATGREPLQRRWNTVVTLRNRAPFSPHEKIENGTLLSPSLRRNQAP
jgi:type IV pilus assembly protein PilW